MAAPASEKQPLSEEERSEVLRVARATLKEYLETNRYAPARSQGAALREARGVFVSLHKSNELRGCIGTFRTDRPLIENVQSMTIAAARDDARFEPVVLQELPAIRIEVSVLSPLREVASPDEVEAGRHGVFLTHGRSAGVLLPQVATEHSWDRETFLEQTCVKAGLPPEAWRSAKVRLEVFTAEVFGES